MTAEEWLEIGPHEGAEASNIEREYSETGLRAPSSPTLCIGPGFIGGPSSYSLLGAFHLLPLTFVMLKESIIGVSQERGTPRNPHTARMLNAQEKGQGKGHACPGLGTGPAPQCLRRSWGPETAACVRMEGVYTMIGLPGFMQGVLTMAHSFAQLSHVLLL